MTLSLISTLDYRYADLADILNRSFAGYLVDVNVNPGGLAQLIRYEGTDLTASRLIRRDADLIGCALIGRRGWTCRLAAMGIIPEARGQGVGRWVMNQLIAEARNRTEQTMVLEVIEQNMAAVRLYQQVDFQIQRRLIGYKATSPEGQRDNQLREVDLREVAWALTSYGLPDLPWQLAGSTLIETGPPNRGYQLGPAYAAISDPAKAQISVRGVIVHPDYEREAWGIRLLQALFAEHPDREWRVPIIFPEEMVEGLFESVGFEREPLTQYQMSRDLTQAT